MFYLIFIPYIGPFLGLIIGPYFLIKKSYIYEFILIMIFSRLSNPVLYETSLNFDILWWTSIYISLFFNILLRTKNPVRVKIGKGLFWFLLVAGTFFMSAFISINPLISFFKVLNWFLLTSLLILGTGSYYYRPEIFQKFLYVLVIFSLLTIPFPSVSYARDGMGFQGLINHPQAFAVLVSTLTVFSLSQKKKFLRFEWVLLLVIIVLIYLTRARTGFLILSSIFLPSIFKTLYEIITLRFNIVSVKRISKLIKSSILMILVLSFFLISAGPGKLRTLILKSEENTNLSEALEDSRGFIIDQQWSNFMNNKIFGIGFGIANSSTHSQEVETYNGVPIGASTEKANLPLAVLEETGILGMVCFIPLMFLITKNLTTEKFLWIAILMANLSEMTFFSYGSFGLLSGVLMAKVISSK